MEGKKNKTQRPRASSIRIARVDAPSELLESLQPCVPGVAPWKWHIQVAPSDLSPSGEHSPQMSARATSRPYSACRPVRAPSPPGLPLAPRRSLPPLLPSTSTRPSSSTSRYVCCLGSSLPRSRPRLISPIWSTSADRSRFFLPRRVSMGEATNFYDQQGHVPYVAQILYPHV